MTIDDLVLVRADGSVEGGGNINVAAYYIHAPVHAARSDVVCAAHCHTPYGTPFSAMVAKLEPISQEACIFFEDHELFDDEELNITSTDGGKRIAASLGGARSVILRNHGLLTCGGSVAEAIILMLNLDRACRVQLAVQSSGQSAYPLSEDVCELTASQ